MGPLSQASLNESLRFAVGLRPVWLDEGVLDTQRLTGLGKQPRAVGCPIVGKQPLDAHTQCSVVGDRRLEEGHGGVLALIGMHLHKARTGMVINGHVSKLPACTPTTRGSIAVDAVAHGLNAPKLLGVHVQQFTGCTALVAHDRGNRLQGLEAGQAQAGDNPFLIRCTSYLNPPIVKETKNHPPPLPAAKTVGVQVASVLAA